MFRKLPILKAIGELPPRERLIFLLPISAVMTLAGVVIIFWNIIQSDQKEKDGNYKDQRKEDRLDCSEKIRRDSIRIVILEIANEKHIQREDSLMRAFYLLERDMYENRVETNRQKRILIRKTKDLLKR